MANHAIPQHPGLIGATPGRGVPWGRGDARCGEAESGRDEPAAVPRARRGEPGGHPGWLVAPAAIWLLLFLLVPLARIVVFSFFTSTGHGMAPDPTIENYAGYFVVEGFFDPESRKFLTPSVFLKTLGTTFRFALTVMVLCLLVGYPIAYFLAPQVQAFKWQLALIVMVITALFSTMLGMAFRRPFRGSGTLFYTIMAGLMVPGILLSLGLATLLKQVGIPPDWRSSGLGVHVVWTLPFGFLVMMAVFNRFDSSLEEAARDMGASEWTVFREVTLPLILPGIVAAGLFGFTLSYDEFARTTLLADELNTLPLDINASTTQRIRPTLFALGTASTLFSPLMIGLFLVVYTLIYRRTH